MRNEDSKYMPQLDAIRAGAIFLVMIQHWAPTLTQIAPWGGIGVRCFFVLSGFLITGILLRARDLVDATRTTRGFQFRQFYIRRSLRIFPIYYLTLIVGCALGMQVMRDTFWWHAAYLSNFYIAVTGIWQGYISHLWSLSVEEQFYLLWPALILASPRRWMPRFFVLAIFAAPLTRGLIAWKLGADHVSLRVLLPCCIDSLVIGATLAWFAYRNGGIRNVPGTILVRVAIASIALMGAVRLMHHFNAAPALAAAVSPTFEAAFFVTIIAAAARGVTGPIGRVLDSRFLQYTGRISYGLYLYHMFAGYVGGIIAKQIGVAFPMQEGVFRFALLCGLSYAAAALSSRLIEAPINGLKRFFPSTPPAAKAPAAVMPAPVAELPIAA